MLKKYTIEFTANSNANNEVMGHGSFSLISEKPLALDTKEMAFHRMCVEYARLTGIKCSYVDITALCEEIVADNTEESSPENVSKVIRFIDSASNEKFVVEDGAMVRLITAGGENRDMAIRYIDEFHFETQAEWGNTIYHISEFAEQCQQPMTEVTGL